MRKILLVMALACLGTPALASDTNSDKKKSPLASDDSKARRAAPAKIGGLLNTDVTPEQARRVTEETNRQILRREKSKTPR